MEHQHMTWARLLWLLRRSEEPGQWILDLPLVCIENCPGCAAYCGELVEMLEAGEISERVDFLELALLRSRRQARRDWDALNQESAEWLRQALKRRPASYGMVDLLVEESRSQASQDKGQAMVLAEAAVEMAQRLPIRLPDDDSLVGPTDDEPLDPPAKAEMLALAHAVHGNAHRVTYKIWEAQRAFQKAHQFLEEAEPEGCIFQGRARVLSMYGSLLTDSRCLEEAITVLAEAQEAADGDPLCSPDLRAAVLIQRARVLGMVGQDREAVVILSAYPDSLVELLPTRLLFCLRFYTADRYLQTDNAEAASTLLGELQELSGAAGDWDLLQTRWIEARIAREQGDHAASIEKFRRLQDEFLERKAIHEAALVALDIALVLQAQSRYEDAQQHAQDAFALFVSLRLSSEAITALALLTHSARRRKVSRELLHALIRFAQGGYFPDQSLWL